MFLSCNKRDWNLGCLPFGQNIRKFQSRIKLNSYSPENPPEVVIFFCTERKGGIFFFLQLLNFPDTIFSSAENNYGNPNCKW